MMNGHVLTTLLRPLAASAFRQRVILCRVPQTPHATNLNAWNRGSSFSTSASRRATEGNPGVKNDPDIVETLDKSPLSAVLSEHPQLLSSVHKFIEIAQEEGIDLTNPNPSFSTMMKMANNQRVREQAIKLRDEFKAAGLDMSKQDALSLLGGMKENK